MIVGIGIDAVEIARFTQWHTYHKNILSKLFSQNELSYVFDQQVNSAQYFAARFAAKEAAFKAVSEYLKTPFLRSFMPQCSVEQSSNKKPLLHLCWPNLIKDEYQEFFSNMVTHISITHTSTTAIAYVIVEKNG
jgi:holo-[acyl-carrier protein] synthase